MTELVLLAPVDDSERNDLAALRALADECADAVGGHVVSQELTCMSLPLETTTLALRVVVQTSDGRFDE